MMCPKLAAQFLSLFLASLDRGCLFCFCGYWKLLLVSAAFLVYMISFDLPKAVVHIFYLVTSDKLLN